MYIWKQIYVQIFYIHDKQLTFLICMREQSDFYLQCREFLLPAGINLINLTLFLYWSDVMNNFKGNVQMFEIEMSK